jgi:hypothetical protein
MFPMGYYKSHISGFMNRRNPSFFLYQTSIICGMRCGLLSFPQTWFTLARTYWCMTARPIPEHPEIFVICMTTERVWSLWKAPNRIPKMQSIPSVQLHRSGLAFSWWREPDMRAMSYHLFIIIIDISMRARSIQLISEWLSSTRNFSCWDDDGFYYRTESIISCEDCRQILRPF